MKVTFRNAFHFSAITAFHAAPAQRFQTRRVGDDGSGWVGPPDPPLSREPAQRQLNRKEIKRLLTRGFRRNRGSRSRHRAPPAVSRRLQSGGKPPSPEVHE